MCGGVGQLEVLRAAQSAGGCARYLDRCAGMLRESLLVACVRALVSAELRTAWHAMAERQQQGSGSPVQASTQAMPRAPCSCRSVLCNVSNVAFPTVHWIALLVRLRRGRWDIAVPQRALLRHGEALFASICTSIERSLKLSLFTSCPGQTQSVMLRLAAVTSVLL